MPITLTNRIIRGAIRNTVALLFISAFLPLTANAQDAGALQRELQLQIERSAPQEQVQPEKPAVRKPSNPNEQKIAIKGFKFKGNTLLSDAQLQAVVKPWTNSDIAFSDLKDVTTAIQDAYAKRNRIAQAIIPPQDIQDGMILIDINEGKMGSVIVQPAVDGQTVRTNLEMAKLYIVTNSDGSQYIDTKPIERGMILLNELPGVLAAGEFEQGDKLGESNFRVRLNDGPLFSGQAALSNYGSYSTGTGQAIVNLALNNPSGYGDQATLDAIQSLGSTYGQLGYSLPVGHDGWRVGVQGSYLTYQTLTSYSSTQTQGTANTVGANATYALLRDNGNNANLRFSAEDRNYDNNQYAQNISKYHITAFTAGVNGNFADTQSSILNYSVTVTSGNLQIDNLTQAGADISGPGTAGSYQKVGFNLSRNQELTFLPKTNWLLSAYGQWANKNLNSSEQIYMGGAYAVRAYPVAQGAGSRGVIFSTELQHRLDDNWTVGVFGDLGVVQQYVNLYPGWQGLTNANNNYQLGDIGPSLKYTYDKWVVNAVAAFRIGNNPLYNSSGQQLNTDNAYRTVQGWVRASYSF